MSIETENKDLLHRDITENVTEKKVWIPIKG